MNKVNKIESDRIKIGCSCSFLSPYESRSGKAYVIKECKACLHKRGKSIIRQKINEHKEWNDNYKEKLKKALEQNKFVLQDLQTIRKPIKRNWFQKLFNIKN